MLYVTMNRLGQVGKTTLARYVLAPPLKLSPDDILTAESSTVDQAEGLVLTLTRDRDHAIALPIALAELSGMKGSRVVDIGNTDVDLALPAVIRTAAEGHKLHVLVPVTTAPKAPPAALQLAEELQGHGVLVTLVANRLTKSDEPAADPGFIELGKAAAEVGALLLPVGLVANDWFKGTKTFADIEKAAKAPKDSSAKTTAEGKLDLAAIIKAGRKEVHKDVATEALNNAREVFEAIQAREKTSG